MNCFLVASALTSSADVLYRNGFAWLAGPNEPIAFRLRRHIKACVILPSNSVNTIRGRHEPRLLFEVGERAYGQVTLPFAGYL